MTSVNRVRVGLFVVTVLALGFNVWFFRPLPHESKRDGRKPNPNKVKFPAITPESGFYPHDMRGKPIGNPEKTIADMHLMHQKMLIFRRLHGKMPKGFKELSDDLESNHKAYGVSDPVTAFNMFKNPDMKNHDMWFEFPNPVDVIAYTSYKSRPDGTPLGTSPSVGTRDVFTFTDMYFHRNAGLMPDNTWKEEHTGFYLVLWEDGEVEKVTPEKVRFVYPTLAGPPECFPGQAGLPEKTYNYTEFWTLAMKNSPVKYAGGK